MEMHEEWNYSIISLQYLCYTAMKMDELSDKRSRLAVAE